MKLLTALSSMSTSAIEIGVRIIANPIKIDFPKSSIGLNNGLLNPSANGNDSVEMDSSPTVLA